MRPAMIFHYPGKLAAGKANRASQLRPLRMIQAFEAIGYDVDIVTGLAADRALAFRAIQESWRNGKRHEFMYSESTTAPLHLHDRLSAVRYFGLDYRFMAEAHERDIPIGLFYRDIYWRFPIYRDEVAWYKRMISIPLYYYDLRMYSRRLDQLFVPSLEYAAALPNPWPGDRISELPPGCTVIDPPREAQAGGSSLLRLLHIGSIIPPIYDIRPALEVVRKLPQVSLTLCCRAEDWEAARHLYEPLLGSNISVVHAQGEALISLYGKMDAALLYYAPDPYRRMAVPIKYYEALGYGTPIIASGPTAVGNFVTADSSGWVVESPGEFRDLLTRLSANAVELNNAKEMVRTVRHAHTWERRAEQVASTLTAKKRAPAVA